MAQQSALQQSLDSFARAGQQVEDEMADYVPAVPHGWSIGQQGEPISPEGQAYAPGTTFDAAGNPVSPGATTGFPVLSTLAGVAAAKIFAPEAKATAWMVAGGIIGYWLRPLE